MSSELNSKNKNIVIVGGGYAGVAIYVELNKKNLPNTNIILISKTNFFYHNVGSLRALVDTKIADDICLKYDKLIVNSNNRLFIHGYVQNINENSIDYLNVENDHNESLKYDYLILALGSNYQEPFHANLFDRSKQLETIKELNTKVAKSTNVLIVGGGAVACELAGELLTEYTNKNITLVTDYTRLVPYMSESFSNKAYQILNDLSKSKSNNNQLEIRFNDKINDVNKLSSSNTITTDNGKEINYDIYFICNCAKPNTILIKSSSYLNNDASGNSALNEKGYIRVKDTFQLINHSNIFAIGDCCDINEPKLAFLAAGHGSTVVYNIEKLINSNNNLKKYKISTTKLMLLTLGRNDGVFQFGPLCIKGFLPTMLKSKGLFIEKYKNLLNYSKSESNPMNLVVPLVIIIAGSFLYFYLSKTESS